jgi:predicted dehydrogenase
MSHPIRLGIVGAGKIVRAEHVPRFRAIDGVEIVAVANRTPASSQQAAAELGIDRNVDDWRALVSDPGVDAVLVGAWPYLHAPVTIAALESGKHVLTEARMAATGAEAREMLRASRAHPDLVAMVVPSSFSLWADATILRLLADGAIGRLRHARVTWHSAGPDEPGEAWRWQRRYSGENAMALGIVYEAMARWFGPAMSVTALSRTTQTNASGPAGTSEIDVPDHVIAILEFPDDVTGTIEMSARTHPLGSNAATFYGTGGTLHVDIAGQAIRVASVGGDWAPVEVRDEDRAGWTAELDFVASIREGRPVTLTDFATGAHYMAVVEAVDRSAARGRREIVAAVT